jgi:alpha-beta hydrolase superfamily lysophospholipase
VGSLDDGGAVVSAAADELSLPAVDGVEVFYRRWLPDGERRAVVLVAHGMSEHSGRYARLADVLTDTGYAVYAPDHRGHGRTSSSTGVGRVGPSGMQAVVDDLDRLRAVAAGEHAGQPLVLFGHSMGALLSQAYVEQHGEGLAGLALSGSPGAAEGFEAMVQMVQEAADGGMADEPMSALTGFNPDPESARTPFDWLSRDDAEVDAYIADPYCGENHPMTYGFLSEMLSLTMDSMTPEYIARIPSSLPILLMTGEQDPASNMGANVRELEKRMRDAGLSVESIWYPGARHEILNETNRDEVTADLVGWIDRVTS